MKKPGTKATNELAGRNAPGMRLKDREPRKGAKQVAFTIDCVPSGSLIHASTVVPYSQHNC